MVRARKDLLKLDKSELQTLNDGFEALVALEGPGGYQHIAGIFGKPGGPHCPTESLLFLPWHRAYLMAFERLLDRLCPGVSLGYWDWTDPATCSRGLPSRLNSVAYSDKDQGVWLNQFCRAPIDCIGHECLSERAPGAAADLGPIVRRLTEASMKSTYDEFAAGLMEASREFRMWVGGHFATDDYAAYDPLFWFHHANLDRLWAKWQREHSAPLMPDSLLNVSLQPFALTVRNIVSMESLPYDYA